MVNDWLIVPCKQLALSNTFTVLTACPPPLRSRLALRKIALLYKNFCYLVGMVGLEPTRLAAPKPKSGASPQFRHIPELYLAGQLGFEPRSHGFGGQHNNPLYDRPI